MCIKIPGLKHGCWERNWGKTPIHPLNLNHKNFIPRSTNWNVIGFQLPVWREWNDTMMSRFQRQTAPRGRQSVETTVSRIKSRNIQLVLSHELRHRIVILQMKDESQQKQLERRDEGKQADIDFVFVFLKTCNHCWMNPESPSLYLSNSHILNILIF